MVFICSRFAGNIVRNVEIAKAMCRLAVESGLTPFAPHLLYTRFLDDTDPAQRELGISMGLRFMEACDVVWVYIGDGISEGMCREMEHARTLGKPVMIYREVPVWLKV
ncbi:MAG: DUF4406 domain-containing protein [Armatimonadota bacterium]|nr:nucleoside 2-deoxyribosyltransferase [bacterium]